MKISRLEQLYRQKLVAPEKGGKELPLARILEKPYHYWPEKPESFAFDILEIGPGRGDFTFNFAKAHPEKNMIAIEIGKTRFEKLCERCEKRGITNLTFVHGDARAPLHNDFPDNQLEQAFVLFPDPWPRNRHRHKRLLQIPFLETLFAKMKPGGKFLLCTDVEDYARWAAHNLSQVKTAKNLQGTDVTPGVPKDVSLTFFAQKWQDMGRKFWSVRFEKI